MEFRIFWLSVVMMVSSTAVAAPSVALIKDAPWSPDDATREGAAELGVLLEVAQLQKSNARVGVVGVGDRRGVFQAGTQRGLEFALRQGVPVVRLADGVRFCAPSPADLFIDGGALSPEAAVELLAHCLERYGALPKGCSSSQPFSPAIRELRAQLARYQQVFTSHQPPVIAQR